MLAGRAVRIDENDQIEIARKIVLQFFRFGNGFRAKARIGQRGSESLLREHANIRRKSGRESAHATSRSAIGAAREK